MKTEVAARSMIGRAAAGSAAWFVGALLAAGSVSIGQEPKKAESGTPAPPRRAPGPVVVSAGDAADALRDPNDRYRHEQVDWSKIPPWRQTSFFGIRSQGQVFVFVVDCSGSMGDGLRLAKAKSELRKTIQRLQFPQRYAIIFYNDQPLLMPGGGARSADQRGKMQTLSWLNSIDAEGSTDPRSALALAFDLQPDAVFLLSDGAFPEGTIDWTRERNLRKVPVHCIDLAGGSEGDDLQRIASESRGQYASRP